jgi:glycosyltransferase involved in cell wall biosynthesis
MPPIVSVITSVYNDAQELDRTIRSIFNQSFNDFEYIIVNDGSHDNTSEILNYYRYTDKRVKILDNILNIGLTASLNRAVNIATGEYIARIDSGDVAAPQRLEKQVSFLEENQDVGIVGSYCIVIFPEMNSMRVIHLPANHKNLIRKLMFRNCFLHSTLMIKKEVFKKIGLFQTRYAQDYDFILRAARYFRLASLPDVLCIRVQDYNSITSRRWRTQELTALHSKLRYYNHIDTDFVTKSLAIFNIPLNLTRFFIPTGFKIWFNRQSGYVLPRRFNFNNLDDYNQLFTIGKSKLLNSDK